MAMPGWGGSTTCGRGCENVSESGSLLTPLSAECARTGAADAIAFPGEVRLRCDEVTWTP
eukprot:3562854-Prymnesium_polylepis.1